MSASKSPATTSASHSTPRPQNSQGSQAVRSESGMSLWGWLAVVLFVTSGIALTVMLILKWGTGGGEVWPWFTRYFYFAFPAAFLCLILALLQTLIQRRRA